MSKAKVMLRPTIEATTVEITIKALRKYRATEILNAADAMHLGSILKTFMKESAKIESGNYGAYIKEGNKSNNVSASVDLEALGGGSGNNGSIELSDNDKLAAMSESEQAEFWASQEDQLMASLVRAG